ncbi:MC family mitochondrial carrier protein [Cadophora sp. DSE1049]|nr:MC family mitochondrial carrier protein [Cadophora sp. DSE1049]
MPKIHYPFWFGGSAASMAACVTHPLDLVKVRLQVWQPEAPKSMLRMLPYIISNEGFRGLYAGLTAALMRQMTYSTTRFGVYEDLKYRYQPQPTALNPHPKLSMPKLILLSGISGFIGGVVGNPADVLNVRMQSDAVKPLASQRNYRNVIEGLLRMVREEGLRNLFRGVGPNASRACAMTTSQLASYDLFKELFIKRLSMADNAGTYLAASVSASLIATTVCSPMDVIKTRVMSGSRQISVTALLSKAVRDEGWLWVFRGWVPSFIRLGPQTACTLVLFEQHKMVYRHIRGIDIRAKMIP